MSAQVRFAYRGGLFIFNFAQPLEDLIKGLLKRRLRVASLAELFYQLYQFVIANSYSPIVLDTKCVQQALYFIRYLLNRGLSALWYSVRPIFLLWRAIVRYSSSSRAQLRTTVVRYMLPLQFMHLRGILQVFFRVLLDGLVSWTRCSKRSSLPRN